MSLSSLMPPLLSRLGVALAPILAVILTLVPAPGQGHCDAADRRLRVVATTTVVADLVRQIAGDRVDIWFTPDQSSMPGPSRLVESSALVSAIAADSIGVGGEIGVAISIPQPRAEAIIAAVRGGVIDLVAVPIEAQA